MSLLVISTITTQSDHLSSKEEKPVRNRELRDLVGGPWPRHLPYDDARERERFNAVAWVADGISWRSGRIQDAADFTTLLCGEGIFA